MRLILHIGTPKTGTSTLQGTLLANTALLERAGTLYPEPMYGKLNHNYVTSLVQPMEDMPREYTSRGEDFETIRARGSAFWEQVQSQVGRSGADVVVLSGEYCYGLSDDKIVELRRMLHQLTNDIQVVCYVRHPAAYYVSLTQQMVKASHHIPAPGEFLMRARACLPRFIDAFDGNVSVRAYDRSTLTEGDVVHDFVSTFVPGGDELMNEIEVTNRNESMSGEAMCIMQALRRHEWPDQNGTFAPESTHVWRTLTAQWDGDDQTAARLTPALHAAVVRRHRADLRYLEEHFGIVLDSHDPRGAECDDDPEPDGWMSHDLTEILDVDPVATERTLYALVRELAARDLPDSGDDSRPGSLHRRRGRR